MMMMKGAMMRQRETEEKGTTREDKEDIGSVGGKTGRRCWCVT